MKRDVGKGMLTTKEAADRLGVPRGRINSWVQSKKRPLPSVKIGGRRYVSEQDLAEYVILLEKAGIGIQASEQGRGTGKASSKTKEDPWIALSAAIVREGMKDYRKALRRGNWSTIRDMERWIRSRHFGLLTMEAVDTRWLIMTMRDKYLN